ncbi:MAG: hypothetical protein K2K84_08670 [Muribaculaceae bacterium]|nr:hypothetical protein [Muribaculaceae bacterium]
MNGQRYILKGLLLFSAITMRAGESDSTSNVLNAIQDTHAGTWQIAEQSYRNPAVNQWRLDKGLTNVGAGYFSRKDSRDPDPRDGTGAHNFEGGAVTYTKYRTSTLWGHAKYSNGKINEVKWNETASPELVYPYLLADSTGGDMNEEIYSFGGGYADARGKLAWGVSLSYDATLQYRNVDPRPKNVTGVLEASAGVMYRFIPGYYAGIGLNGMKYKQTNDIDFKSEMGVDKIFHLTGMANHYNRFAGTGLSTYYNGRRWGVDVNVYPENSKGFFGSGRLSRFTFDNIISDLNKLPMASVWHNMLEAQCGWMARGNIMYGGVSGSLTLYRRHGTENIFGDAASSIYPQIGSNEMFADNAVEVSVTGRWGIRRGPLDRFQITVTPEWGHRTMAYIEPYSYKDLNYAKVTAGVYGSKSFSDWLVEISVKGIVKTPYHCTMSQLETDNELKGLAEAEAGAYTLESSRMAGFYGSIGATRKISRYAAGISGSWDYESYADSMKRNKIKINITFTF